MNRVAVGVVAVVAALSGCAAPARIIQKGPDSGVVAIPENTDVWPTHYRAAAEALIKQHIGPNYMIVSESEVVTGGNNNAGPTASVPPASKEYRITYQRKQPMLQGNPIGGPLPLGARPAMPPGAGLGAGPQPAGATLPAGAYVPGGLTGANSSPPVGVMNASTVPSVGPATASSAGGYSYTSPYGKTQ